MLTDVTTILGTRNKDLKHPSSLDPRTKCIDPKTQQTTESIADYLVDKFDSPGHRMFFLKVAWRLDKRTIDRLVGTAFELGINKRAYFIKLVKNEKLYYTQK